MNCFCLRGRFIYIFLWMSDDDYDGGFIVGWEVKEKDRVRERERKDKVKKINRLSGGCFEPFSQITFYYHYYYCLLLFIIIFICYMLCVAIGLLLSYYSYYMLYCYVVLVGRNIIQNT